jgi:4-amino-4-deoxy-L-arabinose transferase-like glycosyltransferase
VNESKDKHQDWYALLALGALFVAILAATWQRWTHPIIDHGREMNVPLRVLQGERLYSDISYHYGPFAPYFNALLYQLFGVHLNTLHASGLVCAVLTLLMIYWLARRLLSPWEAALPTALVLVTCALAGYIGNFIQPYAYAALYGWTFALASLVCLTQYVISHRNVWMWWAGVCVGVTVTCKPELAVQGSATIAVAWMLASLSERRWLWRALAVAAIPAVAIAALTYGAILISVPWQLLITESYRLLNQPQIVFFSRFLNGTLGWPRTGWALMSAAGMTLAACGLAPLLGLMLDQRVHSLLRREAWPSWICIVAGAGLWAWGGSGPQIFDVTPLRSAPLVLTLMIVVIAWQLWRRHSRGEPFQQHHQILFLIGIFSLIGIGRVVLNLSLWSPYTLFTAPTVFVLFCFVFLRAAPAALLASPRARFYARNVAMVLVVIWVASLGIQHVESARLSSVEINAPRGRLLTDVTLGQPLADAIRFAAARTQPGDYVLNVPQGSIINFLADRPNPLREDIIIPGMLPPDREAEAIERVAARGVKLILVSNHLTPEYRDWAFGVSYNQAFMRWIDAHYHPVATFSAFSGRELQFGDYEFFIRAYERNPEAR